MPKRKRINKKQKLNCDYYYNYYRTPAGKKTIQNAHWKPHQRKCKSNGIDSDNSIQLNGFQRWRRYLLSDEDDNKLIEGYIRKNIDPEIIPNDISSLCVNFWGKLEIPKVGDYVQLTNDIIGQIKWIGIPDRRKKKERIIIQSCKSKAEYQTKRQFIERVIPNPNESK